MIEIKLPDIVAIHCDASGCERRRYGTVATAQRTVEEARECGWQINLTTHFCSECVQKEEATVGLKRTIAELEKRERRHLLTIDRLRRGQFTEFELEELATNLPPDDLAIVLIKKRMEVAEREKDGES